MDYSKQPITIQTTLDELFKKIFPGLAQWIEKIHIVKEETKISEQNHPTQ